MVSFGVTYCKLAERSIVKTTRAKCTILVTVVSFPRGDFLPVALHADHGPAALLRLVIKRLGEGADLEVWQPLRRPIGIRFARFQGFIWEISANMDALSVAARIASYYEGQ